MPRTSLTSLACLPYELRSYIWSLAVEPRHITNLRTVKSKLPFKQKQRKRGLDILYETTSTSAPAIMHVCRESRQHAPYQRAFTAGTEPRWTWVNFELDIFCVSSVYCIEDIISHRSDVHRLHIRTGDDRDWYEAVTTFDVMKILYEFVGLREIQIVLPPGSLMWEEIFAERDPFGYCPRENITFVDEGSGLMLTGPQLRMVGDWRWVFSFDSEMLTADPEDLSVDIEYALRDDLHLTLAQMHEID